MSEKPQKIFLGKKRLLKNYKTHSLIYNELKKLLNESDDINLNINTLNAVTNINPSIIKGNFIGFINNNNDILIETKTQNNSNLSTYIIYDTKNSFNKKLQFTENSRGHFFLLNRIYGACLLDTYIKIYYFYDKSTKYDIVQRIELPENQHYRVLFPFSFTYNNDLYFYLKPFSLREDNEILFYKLKKEDKNNNEIKYNPFIESIILELNFAFVWFVQKNNTELLFFYEKDFNFIITSYNFETSSIIHTQTFKLNYIKHSKIANYPNEIISGKYLPLSIDNMLYIIDVENWQISSVKELDTVQIFKVFHDDTFWTIESKDKEILMENNKKKLKEIFYVRQYKLHSITQELIKIGERKFNNNESYTRVDNILELNNNKVILFMGNRKIKMFKEK